MKIKFLGGVKSVTGANYLVETKESKFLVDCGLIQGFNVCELENFEPFDFNSSEIDFVLITHAHLDHIGRLPKLFKEGFNNYIYSVLPTKDLAREMFLDSIKVIEENCKFLNKESFYDENDIEKVLGKWLGKKYNEKIKIKDVEFEFYNAGHILGSAFIRISSENINLIFSGDLGNINPLLEQTSPLPEDTDYLVLESTYGDRLHQDLDKRKDILEDIVEETIKEKRTLIIPAFALERSQEILYDLIGLIEDKKVPEIDIFLDSPLGIRILKTYEHYPDFLSERAKDFFTHRDYSKLNYLKIGTSDYEIKNFKDPKIIISSSGMLKGGKIMDILKIFIEKETTTILFVGFQPEGSLGRKILEGEKEVIIDGEKFKVNAKIEKILSYSGHKDQQGILDWVYPLKNRLKKIFLVQGDFEAKKALKIKLEDYLGIKTIIPKEKEEYIL
jgi:metallo-beta-lactamase family protein